MGRRQYRCNPCQRIFPSAYLYKIHADAGSNRCRKTNITCRVCKKSFATSSSLKRHMLRFHPVGSEQRCFTCGICEKVYDSRISLNKHRASAHKRHHFFHLRQSAHKKQCQILRCFFPCKIKTVSAALFYAYRKCLTLLESLCAELRYFKCNPVMTIEMGKLNECGLLTETTTVPFRGGGFRVSLTQDFTDALADSCGEIDRNVDEFLLQVKLFFKQ